MRRRRGELGLTVRDVALGAGLRGSSASYISQLESGAKAPHRALARRLAEVLRDDPRIYLAWAALGKRSDPVETARAIGLLSEILGHPAYQLPSRAMTTASLTPTVGESEQEVAPWTGPARRAPSGPPEPDVSLEPLRGPDKHERPPAAALPKVVPPGAGPPAPTLVLVPELDEGADPGDATRAAPRVIATHRIDPDTLEAAEQLVRSFAYRLSEPGVRRVRDVLGAGDIVVLTRRTWPLQPSAPYAVRLSGHVLLSRVMWNERQLLLLPGPGDSDFIVLDAPGRTVLERLLAGKVSALLRAIP